MLGVKVSHTDAIKHGLNDDVEIYLDPQSGFWARTDTMSRNYFTHHVYKTGMQEEEIPRTAFKETASSLVHPFQEELLRVAVSDYHYHNLSGHDAVSLALEKACAELSMKTYALYTDALGGESEIKNRLIPFVESGFYTLCDCRAKTDEGDFHLEKGTRVLIVGFDSCYEKGPSGCRASGILVKLLNGRSALVPDWSIDAR